MNPIYNAVLGILFIFFGTTLGASFVLFFKNKEIPPKINEIFLGFATGIMLSASFFSLLKPALEIETSYMPIYLIVGIATLLGALFLWGIDKLVPHFHASENKEEGLPARSLSKTGKMFLAVTIHNIPEGLSVGIGYGIILAAYQTDPTVSAFGALMLAIGIGIQNIPEGAVVSLPVKGETGSSKKAFLFGTMSGIVEPIAAVIGLFLAMQVASIMPWALAFAAGCMLYVIAEEMIPEFKGDSIHHHGVWAFIIGFIVMMILDNAF